ncbi:MULTISPECIES: DUF5954 family protein [Actinomadura]|uniref:DUF5954 family protein n=1 Tax=Actinomadura TaxID=1988 RepID=UPI0007C4CB9D|nr:DUF5954 family protein [Actinomadura madurae]MCP9971590.1 DUF5954 family protein [Actinomadura madurae]URN00335.1 DUF5954 family protein [Actinomadura madurae]URN02487.1 DUF5954 family protein [Actinomadura madurae]
MTTGDGDAGGRLFPEDLDGVDPVAAVMLADACRAASAYPEPVVVGALFTAAERVPGGWQIVCPCDPLPQGARELLAVHLEDLAALCGGAEARVLLDAARTLQRAPSDEVVAGARRFRIVRIEQLVRTGPDGPEPPRPTDLDPLPARRVPLGRPYDLLPDDGPASGGAAAELLHRVLDTAAAGGAEPPGAFLTPVALAPVFTVAERGEKRWRPVGRLYDAPQQARDSLVTYFRHVVPAVESPAATDLERFAEAAELMEAETRRNGIAVAGRRFRIVRIERITLMGPDGPEPPRASDFDAR